MKKTLLNLFIVLMIGFGFVLGDGCFHDAIDVVNKPGVVTRGANIRNIACMDGSEVIATLKQGTKVRIIGQTAWTKIVMPDGRIGRIGNSFIREDSNWAGVPELNSNHLVNSYCDTTNISRCPYPSAPGVKPTFYTANTNQNTVVETPKPQTQEKPIMKSIPALDELANQFLERLEQEGLSQSQKLEKIKNIINALNTVKKSYPKMASLIDYLVYKIQG